MTEQERKKFNELVNQVEKLTIERERIYHNIWEVPYWARPTIQKLLDKELFTCKSESDLDLSESLMKNLVINDKAHLYD